MRFLSTIPTPPTIRTSLALCGYSCLHLPRTQTQLHQHLAFSTTSHLIPRQTPHDDPSISVAARSSLVSPPPYTHRHHTPPRPPRIPTVKSPADKSFNTMPSDQAKRPPPPPTHVLETALQVRDIAASTKFYRETLGVQPSLDTVS